MSIGVVSFMLQYRLETATLSHFGAGGGTRYSSLTYAMNYSRSTFYSRNLRRVASSDAFSTFRKGSNSIVNSFYRRTGWA